MFSRRNIFWSLTVIVFATLFFAGASAAASDGPIVILESPADGTAFYQGQQVQAAYGCVPGPLGSPVIACEGDVPLGEFIDTSSVGVHTLSVHAVDYAGAETTVTHTYTVFDVVPPAATVATPADHTVYPYGAQALVHYSCDDGSGGSGIAGCFAPIPDGAPLPTSQLGTFTFTVDAYDLAGNHGSTTVTYTVADVTPPAITLSLPADHAVYAYGSRIFAHYWCDDGPGGSGIADCNGPIPDGAWLPANQLGTFTFIVNAADRAGNRRSESVTYSVADLTPPTITITSPADGAQFQLDQFVTPGYSCQDNIDGLPVSCKATPIDTSTYGPHTFRVDAKDSAGNAASATRTYYVPYKFTGFLAPLASEPTISNAKAGDDLPAKFSLNGNQGLDVLADQPVWRSGCTSASVEAGPATGALGYNAAVDRYVFLAKTERSWAGSCRQLILTLDDGTVHRANVSFR